MTRARPLARVNGAKVTDAGARGSTDTRRASSRRPSTSSATSRSAIRAAPRFTIRADTVTRSRPADASRSIAAPTTAALAGSVSVTGTGVTVTPAGSFTSCARSHPVFWKSEMTITSRRGRRDDSSRPAAARSAGPYRVAPDPSVA